MPDRYGDDDRRGYRPPGAKLDIGGLPVCDSTHPQCCADLERYRKTTAQKPQNARTGTTTPTKRI